MAKEQEKFSNIFEAASSAGKKPVAAKEVPAGPPLTDDEIKERFERYKELHNMIHDKLEKVLEEKNLTKRQVHDYFDKPQNFTARQWQLIEAERDETEKKLKELVPKKAAAKEKRKSGKEKGKKPKRMQTKSRWIQM